MLTRREFSTQLLRTLTGVAFLNTLFTESLLAEPIKPITSRWLKNIHTLCADLKRADISPTQWQAQIDELHRQLPLEDLITMIDFEKAIENFEYPDLGVVVKDPVLPKVTGISDRYSFTGRIFGMEKKRAIIPHGHKNMTSCHRVLKGKFLLRQYDRVADLGDSMIIRPTIEEVAHEGSFSSISDEQNNVHWLVAETERAFTFDVIVGRLGQRPTEIDNIDIYESVRVESDLLKVKKMDVDEALKKYGKSHH